MLRKRILSVILAATMLLSVLPSSMAVDELTRKNPLLKIAKSSYSMKELNTIFPDADLSADSLDKASELQKEGIIPLSLQPGSEPTKAFVHEFDDESKLYLDVYADNTYSIYGFTLGTKTGNSTSGYTYTDTLVYWYAPMGITPIPPFVNCWDYKVTHTAKSTGSVHNVISTITSHRKGTCWGGEDVNFIKGTNTSNMYILYYATFTDYDGGPSPLSLMFNTSYMSVTTAPWTL